MFGKADQPADLDRSDDLIGDQDVANARSGHHFGLTQLRARDSDRAGRELHVRNLRCLVRLRMRPPSDTMRTARGDDPRDVRFHDVQIDQERWRIQRRLGLADQVMRQIRSSIHGESVYAFLGMRCRPAAQYACSTRRSVSRLSTGLVSNGAPVSRQSTKCAMTPSKLA